MRTKDLQALDASNANISTESKKYKRKQPELPAWRAHLYEKMALKVLDTLPAPIQLKISKKYATVFNKPWTARLIEPYCKYHYQNPNYLDDFVPASGASEYQSFQDFFARRLKSIPNNQAEVVWPCEGNLCHAGYLDVIPKTNVKGAICDIYSVFGLPADSITTPYYFTNIFLHNKNYHRIHAPVSGTITRIQHKPGRLVVLRPWIYRDNPSEPAFRNERYNVDITADNGAVFHLSIVGGPAVASIDMLDWQLGDRIEKLNELAVFRLGSTCCMLAPVSMKNHYQTGDWVEVGQTYF